LTPRLLAIPVTVWTHWGLSPESLQVIPQRGGFSGAKVFRCRQAHGQETSLRCWPPHTSADRVAQVQSVVRTARQQGCDLVPQILETTEGRSFLTCEDRHWEMLEWLSGRPWQISDQTTFPVETAVARAAAAVGRFQAAVRPLASHLGVAPAVLERCERLQQAANWFREPALASGVPQHPPWVLAADQVAREIWQRLGGRWQASLQACSNEKFQLQYVLRDIHDQHVLFADGQVRGIIDYDALRIDSPATDLARLVAGFAALSCPTGKFSRPEEGFQPIPVWRTFVEHELWNRAVAGFRECCPFSEREQELAVLLADVTTLLSLVNWVNWLASPRQADRRSFAAGVDAVRQRVEQLTDFAVNYYLQ